MNRRKLFYSVASAWRALVRLFEALLSCTMPKTSALHPHYPRGYAALLPLSVPLFLALTQSPGSFQVTPATAMYGGASSLLGCALVFALYPANGHYHGPVSGVFTVMAFLLSIAWLNLAGSQLVSACVVLGRIFAVQPATLAATVLAWGNSMPDLVNNIAMAADGFPTMAVTACFASPLFTLLGGTSFALTAGAIAHGGAFKVNLDVGLRIMYGFTLVNMVKFLLLVPLSFRYKLNKTLAYIALGYYCTYQVTYLLGLHGTLSSLGA